MQLSIWNTAGQERFESVTKMYYRDSDAALIVYDVTFPESFEKTKKWVRNLNEYCQSS